MSLLGSLGSLNVLLTADTAQFTTSIDKAAFQAAVKMEQMAYKAKINSALFAAAWSAAGLALVASLGKFIESGAELDKLTQKTGVSVEALSRLQYAAKIADIDFQTLTIGINKFNKNIGENSYIFKQLGINTKDASGHLRDTKAVLDDVATLFAKYKDGAGKADAAQQLFGRSGADLIPLLNLSKEGLDKLGEASDKMGITMTDKAAKASALFKDRITELQAKVSGLLVQLGEPTVDAINKFWEAVAGPSKKFEDKVNATSAIIDNMKFAPADDAEVFKNELAGAKIVAGDINTSVEATADKLKDWVMLTDAASLKFKTIREDAQSFSSKITRIADDIGEAFASNFEEAIIEAKKFGDVIQGLAKDIERTLLRNLVTGPLANALSTGLQGMFAPSLTSQVNAFTPVGQTPGVSPYTAPTFSAHGNAFLGNIHPFANGGIFNGPTLFPMRNGTGLAGEAGQEAILPLTRTPSGDLGVRSAGGGSKVEINVYAPPGSKVSQETQTDSGGMEKINLYIDEATAKNISNPSSRSYKAMKSTFGATQSLTKR